MKLLAIALLICMPVMASDKWTGEDKGWHLMAGAAVSTVSTIKWESRTTGFAAGCGASVAFELLAPGLKSYKDAVVGCLGAAFGAVIGGWHVEGQRNGVKLKKEF